MASAYEPTDNPTKGEEIMEASQEYDEAGQAIGYKGWFTWLHNSNHSTPYTQYHTVGT